MPISMPKTVLEVPTTGAPLPGDAAYGEEVTYDGDRSTLHCIGTFDGGTVTLQISYDAGVTWFTCPDTSGTDIEMTANAVLDLDLGGTPLLRTKLTGSGGTTDVLLEIYFCADLTV